MHGSRIICQTVLIEAGDLRCQVRDRTPIHMNTGLHQAMSQLQVHLNSGNIQTQRS